MNVKTNEDQFLGKQELNRIKRSLQLDGYQRAMLAMSGTYGVVKIPVDVSFDALKIIQGSTVPKLTLKAGMAIDIFSQITRVDGDQVDVLTTPTDSVLRYVIISYDKDNREEGDLTLSTDGSMVGNGNTLFTDVLRGAPNFPVKIKFPNSVSNLGEYEVLSVTDDLNAKIVGASFVAEIGLRYEVVGTFTPGKIVPSPDKLIYEYDFYKIRLDVSPALISNIEFLLASVSSNGVATTINDLRASNLYNVNFPPPSNPVAQAAVYDAPNSVILLGANGTDGTVFTVNPAGGNVITILNSFAPYVEIADGVTVTFMMGGAGTFKNLFGGLFLLPSSQDITVAAGDLLSFYKTGATFWTLRNHVTKNTRDILTLFSQKADALQPAWNVINNIGGGGTEFSLSSHSGQQPQLLNTGNEQYFTKLSFMLDTLGFVNIRGSFNNPGNFYDFDANAIVIFKLPSGYVPAKSMTFVGQAYSAGFSPSAPSSAAVSTPHYVNILIIGLNAPVVGDRGKVYVIADNTGDAKKYIDFGNIKFNLT